MWSGCGLFCHEHVVGLCGKGESICSQCSHAVLQVSHSWLTLSYSYTRVSKTMLSDGPHSSEDLATIKLLLENCLKLLHEDKESQVMGLVVMYVHVWMC